jgi:prepilin-type processing-associated H-X9-DG protein
LLELLIVAAILIILMTTYWGSSSASRQRKHQAACQKNLQKIYVAMTLFANDHAGKFPDIPGARSAEEALAGLVPLYTVGTDAFICPGSKDAPLPPGESFRNRRISYAYYMGRWLTNSSEALMSDRQVDTLAKSAGQLAFSNTGKAPGNNHNKFGGNFLFCDGHMELTPPLVPFAIGLAQGVTLLNPK